MRQSWLTLVGIVMLASALRAQQPAQAPPGNPIDPGNNKLDALLLRWEQEMKTVQTLVAQCTRTTVDKTFQKTDIYEGTAKYMKPNLAMLKMDKKGKPGFFEKYVSTGNFLYEYNVQNSEVRVHEMPPSKQGQVADDSFLAFLFGMKAEEAKRRYDLRLAKEDQWYYYIEIAPRLAADKADFQKARLVLSNRNFLPRELWFEQPNGNEVKWDIPKIESGAPLNRTEFVSPEIPQGWRQTRIPRGTDVTPRNDVPPRVIRPNQ